MLGWNEQVDLKFMFRYFGDFFLLTKWWKILDTVQNRGSESIGSNVFLKGNMNCDFHKKDNFFLFRNM